MSYAREIFEAWAPVSSPWSKYAKPVLFAHVNQRSWRTDRLEIDFGQLAGDDAKTYRESAHHASTALVIDLPGASSVAAGLAAAQAGFQPVPLFNALPGDNAYVDVWPIVGALEQFAQDVKLAGVLPNAPPAFLLDEHRIGDRPSRGFFWFDNRSVCFPTDFPSGAAFRSAGISRVVIVTGELSYDLLAIVDQWKREGLAVDRMELDGTVTPARAGFFAWMQRLTAGWDRLTMHQSESGAFGKRVIGASG